MPRTRSPRLPANLRPKTPAHQWKDVQEWYEHLEAERDSDRPAVNSFNDAWDMLSGLYEDISERGMFLKSTADAPLAALFYFVEMGFYPPPELLFALLGAWESYVNGCGEVSLEEAFLGRPRPKAGNYARRKQTLLRKMSMAWDMTKYLRQGMTRMQAAERICADWESRGVPLDPETIVRTIHPFGKAKKEK